MSQKATDNMAGTDHNSGGGQPGRWARLLGYLYHYWNGICFVIAFLLLFHRRPWLAIPYMGIVYASMVAVMGLHGFGDFVLEATGHLAFGAILAGTAAFAFRPAQPALAGS